MVADKLKKSVLQAAIQGKLTKQLPTDGDAKDLLKKIRDEKNKLIADGKIKNEKSLPPITAEEIPFDIPDNWQWVRLGDLTELITKGSSPKWQGFKYVDKGVLFITSENVGNEILKLTQRKYVEEKFNVAHSSSILNFGDILTNIVGASIGRTTRYELNLPANINQAVSLIRLIEKTLSGYIVKYLNSPVAYKIMMAQKVETARANISLKNIAEFLIPLPPLAEQKRIVEKLEKILSEVESLAESEIELEELEKNFSRQMKNSILQAAIQGKLTKQLPTDGDAKDLLKQICAEKSKLIADGKIKNEKSLPPITAEEIPFCIPDNWQWVRLGEIIDLLSGQDLTPQDYNSKKVGVPYITGASNFAGEEILINRWTENPIRLAYEGDLLVTCKGSVGTMAIMKIKKAHIARQIMCVHKSKNFSVRYLKHFLQSMINHLQKNKKGIIPGIDRKTILELLFPLPPLAEQKRIVERLEELLPLCEI